MGKVARPRIVTKDALDKTGLPEHVQVVLAEIAAPPGRACSRSRSPAGSPSRARSWLPTSPASAALAASTTTIARPTGTAPSLASCPSAAPWWRSSGPRMRSKNGCEVPLPSYRVFARRDLLDEMALGRMLAGLSTRRYRAGEAPVGVELQGTSRSAISRRFRRATEARLAEVFGRDLSGIDLLTIFIGGIAVGRHVVVVALGVDSAGTKHPLGLWEGTTENKAVCSGLLGNLIDRGLDASRPVLFVIDGGKGIRSAIKAVYGGLAPVQRCRKHKERNVTDHLPRPSAPLWRASFGRRGPVPMFTRPSGSSERLPSTWSPSIPGRRRRSLRGWRRRSPSPVLGSPRRCFGPSRRRTPSSR